MGNRNTGLAYRTSAPPASATSSTPGRRGQSPRSALTGCPRWDSNPHCLGFESSSSASWDTRASRFSRFPTIEDAPRSLIGRATATMCPMTGSPTNADKPRRVLVAEDEALIRLDLAEMLREEGYEIVGEAGDGQEAVDLAESLRPDLVIMDVKMPRRDGIDAASEIASKRIAPIVILTAFSQRDLVERARDGGAMAYLVKPFNATDLIPAIEVAVSRFSEISVLENEVATLSDRLETRKLVERAKGLLQTKQGMSEPEAFKWIQRAAMDRRTTMKRVAEVVLETLDTPEKA